MVTKTEINKRRKNKRRGEKRWRQELKKNKKNRLEMKEEI